MEDCAMNTDETRELLQEIDAYVEDLFTPSDEILEAALRDSRRAGLPEINVSPNQGRLLQLLTEKVGIRVGDAHELLASLIEDDEGPFDVIFIDADKESCPEYLDASLRLVRSGSLILGDNTIRGGTVLDPKDATAQATREFNKRITGNPRLSSIALPLIRERIDGLTIARVL